MRKFKLDNRLQTCADFVTVGADIADIGTDHAYLPIWLAMHDKIKSAIASDINILPLKKAEENLKKYNMENKIKILQSNGLEKISPYEVDEIVIAGMGGEMISQILDTAPWVKKEKKKLILQPVSSESDLRIYLRDNGFKLEKEKAVLSLRRVYTVINAVYTETPKETAIEYPYVGKLYEKIDKLAVEYLKRQIRDLENRNKGNVLRGNKEDYFLNLSIINRIKGIINDFGGERFGRKSS